MKFLKYVFISAFILLLTNCREGDKSDLIIKQKNPSDTTTSNNWVYDPTPSPLQLPSHFSFLIPPPEIPEDNPLTFEGIELGKRLFFEKKLSKNNSISCASCHKPQFAFNDKGKALSLGVDGKIGVRNAMPLFNLAWNKTFSTSFNYEGTFNWHGSAESLEKQAFEPVVNQLEMQETWPNVEQKLQADQDYPRLFFEAFGSEQIDSNLVVKALAQFERTLISGDSKLDNYIKDQSGLNYTGAILNTQEKRGMDIFVSERGDCAHCHGTPEFNPLLTDFNFRNNGLDQNPDSGLALVTGKASDVGKFKTPSLRNLVYTAPYMHDGSIATIEEVVDFYSTGVNPNSQNIDPLMFDRGSHIANLTQQEKNELVAFLKAITDSSFVQNPNFRP